MSAGGYDKDKAEAETAKWGRMLHMNERLGLTPWTRVGEGVGRRAGSVHYYNLDTGDSVWTDDFHPEWLKIYSRKKIKYCWVNQFTNQTVWRKPKSYKKPPSRNVLMRFMETGPLKSAMLIQHEFRQKQERLVMLVKQAREVAHLNVAGWVTVIWHNPNPKRKLPPAPEDDEEEEEEVGKSTNGTNSMQPNPDVAPYYFHGRNNELVWDKPVELRDAELREQAMEAGDRTDNVVAGWVTCLQKKPHSTKPHIVWDEKVGDEFYYHVKTNELIIGGDKNKPEKLKQAEDKPPEWIRLYDPGNEKYYYYNQKTEATEWRRPATYKKPPRALLLRGLTMRPELKAAMTVQNCWRQRKARQGLRRKRATENLAKGEGVRMDWVELWDFAFKCNYWYQLGPPEIFKWKKPPCLVQLDMPKWVKLFSPKDVDYYWYNNFTQKVVWEPPEDYVEPKKGSKSYLLMSPEVNAACLIQNAYRARQARRVKYARLAKSHQGEAFRGWVKMPQGYYWCVETDEVAWKLPPALGGGGNSNLRQEWCRMYANARDGEYGGYYYCSNWSFEISNNQPPGWIEPPKNSTFQQLVGPYLSAVVTIQCAWRCKRARREKRKKLASSQLARAVNGWVDMEWRWMDKTSGRRRVSHYWWSQNTNEITWEKPPELGGGANADMPEWVKVFSPSDERFYYYSNWTHETLWTIPENYTAPPTGMAARMLMSPELRGALVIQCVWRKKQARRVVRSAKARHMATIDNARVFRGWVTEWDHTAKADFYFNIDTGEISWTMPTVLMVPKWIKVHDPTTNWHYYVNNDTGEQQTTTPDDYQSPRGPHAKLLSKMITNPELRGAMAIQRAFRSRQSRRLAYASQLHRRMVEVAETYEAIIPRDGALGFHLVQPEGDVGGVGVGDGALPPGSPLQQYPASVQHVVAHGQAEIVDIQQGDLLSSIGVGPQAESLVGLTMKEAIAAIRKQDRPMTLRFRRRFVPDPAYPRVKYPRIPLSMMGWFEVDFMDIHYGKVRYWWKVDTHHLTITPPPPFAAQERARKEASQYQPRSPEMKETFRLVRVRVDAEPRNPLPRMELARLHLKDGNPRGAMKQMERVQKTPKLCDAHADDAGVWELTGDAYFAMYQEEWTRKYLDVAWRAYQKMAQKSVVPKPHALMNLAMCYEAYGSYEGAALVLGDLLSLHKDWEGYDDAVFQAGVLLKHLKQYEDASLYLAYLAAHDVATVSSTTIWFQVAHCFHLAGDDESAMEGIKQIFHSNRRDLRLRDPPITTPEQYIESSAIWDEQGHELFDRGMYTMAADAFRHALLRAPSPWETWPETWANLALSLHRTCEKEQAESVLLKAIEIHEGNEMLEKLHLKISAEYAAKADAEQRAAIMLLKHFRRRIKEKREAKVQAALEDATFQKAAEMLRHILEGHALSLLKKWREYTRYVVGIRKFSEHIMGNAKRICMEGWKKYYVITIKEKGFRNQQAAKIVRCVRAYNIRTIPMRARRERKRQDAVVKKFARRMQMMACVRCLVSWQDYVDKMKRARRVYEKIVKRYMKFCFYAWVDYTRSLPTLYFYGATQMQRQWRGMVARVELKRLRNLQRMAAELIQRRIRQRVAMVKAKYKRWKTGIVHKKAATKFQKVRRGYLRRRHVWRDMVHGAVIFQAAWRSKRCRLHRGFAARKIQVAWAVAYVKRMPVRDEAAARVQAVFRGHVCRLWLALNEAATQIERIYRGHAGRSKVNQIRGRLRKFWAHLLFSNEVNGVPGNMTERMIEDGDGDWEKRKDAQEAGVSVSGFLASPERKQRLVPSVWSKYPIRKENIRTLAGGGGGGGGGRVQVPVFASPRKKTIMWIPGQARASPQKSSGRATKNLGPLPAFAVQQPGKDGGVNLSAVHDVAHPSAPRLFADTTMSTGWSSLHAIYVMPPEEARPARPPSAAVERLRVLARDLPDEQSEDVVSSELYEAASYGGFAGVYASSSTGGGSGGGGGSRYDGGEWGGTSRESSYVESSAYEESAPSPQPAARGKIQFPAPHVGLRQRKQLLGRALGKDTAKVGSAAHVVVESGDMGLLQSFMKLRAGGRAARSMISKSVGVGGGETGKKLKARKGRRRERR